MSFWRHVLVDRRRLAVPLVILLAANIAVTAFLVLPLRQRVAAREQEALSAMADLAAARREDAQVRSARDGALAAESDLKHFHESVLPQGFDAAVQLTGFWLTRVAGVSGVQFQRGKYDPERLEESTLERMTAKATLSGDYDGVRRFLHAVEEAPEFVIIDRIELAQPADQTEDRLELLLDVSTYYRARGAGLRARTPQ